MYYDQREFDVRCEWGREGLSHLLPESKAIVVVDVLSFSTCVDIAVGNGAVVYPYRGKASDAADYAKAYNAILADSSRENKLGGYSLAPSSLLEGV